MASESKHSKNTPAPKGQSGLPPLHLGILVAALILVVGIGYVFMTQGGSSGPTPTPTIRPSGSATPFPGNATLPAQTELTGKDSCAANGTHQVLLFTDPYCPACAQTEPQVNAFYEKYSGSVDVQYRFVRTHSRTLSPVYGIDTVYRAHDYHVCAQEQDKVQEFKKCFYTKLQTKNGDYIPETKADLDGCASVAGLDRGQLDTCLDTARAKVDASIEEAVDFGGGSYYTPMAIVDCKYRVSSVLAEQTLCAGTDAC